MKIKICISLISLYFSMSIREPRRSGFWEVPKTASYQAKPGVVPMPLRMTKSVH